jgi:hypothetical protein
MLQLDCNEAMATTPVCTVRDSYRVVYMLLRGDSLVDPMGFNQFSSQATVLVASFLAIFAIFILAVLITVFTASSELDFEQIALCAYWEPVLGFILSTGVLVKEMDTATRTRSIEQSKGHFWDIFTRTLLFDVPSTESNLFVYPLRSIFLTRIIAGLIVPIWIFLGVLSLGLFWPPQIRRWLFVSSLRNSSKPKRSATNESCAQMSEVHNEILQMKCMSYERSQKLEDELREMKELLIAAMQD